MVRWRTRWRGGGPVPFCCAGARVPCRSGGCFRGCTTSWIPTSGRSEPESRGRGGEGIGPGHTFSVGIVSAPPEEPDKFGRTARATAVFAPSRAGQHKGRPHAITPDPLVRPLLRPRWRGDDLGVRVVVLDGSGVRCEPRSLSGDQGSRPRGSSLGAPAHKVAGEGGGSLGSLMFANQKLGN